MPKVNISIIFYSRPSCQESLGIYVEITTHQGFCLWFGLGFVIRLCTYSKSAENASGIVIIVPFFDTGPRSLTFLRRVSVTFAGFVQSKNVLSVFCCKTHTHTHYPVPSPWDGPRGVRERIPPPPPGAVPRGPYGNATGPKSHTRGFPCFRGEGSLPPPGYMWGWRQ